MSAQNLNSKSGIKFILIVTLYFFANLAHGKGNSNQAPTPTRTIQSDQFSPASLAQTLIPEAVLAIHLTEALKLDVAPNAEKAEALLSSFGIEPKNGWITEYPVTPAILGELETAIASSNGQIKLTLSKDQALKLFATVKKDLGLDIEPDNKTERRGVSRRKSTLIYSYVDANGVSHFTDVYHSIPEHYRETATKIHHAPLRENTATPILSSILDKIAEAPKSDSVVQPNPQVINHYYREQGPPIITYYSPPEIYYVLYSWVAYPFWCSGQYYPGFFVLNNFHRQVKYHQQPFFVSHHTPSDHQHAATKPPESSAPSIGKPIRPHSIVTTNQNPYFSRRPERQLASPAEYPLNQEHSFGMPQRSDNRNNGYAQPIQRLPHLTPGIRSEHSIEHGRVIINTPKTFGGVESNRVFGR